MVTFPMTLTELKPGFQGHGIFEVEYLKTGLRTKLLWNTNRKPYAVYQMVPLSMSSITLERDFKVAIFFDIDYLSNDTR